MMYEYDVVKMVKDNNRWVCQSNTVQQRELAEQDAMELDRYRFLMSPLSETEVEIIVNRLDVSGLTEATQQFYDQYQQ